MCQEGFTQHMETAMLGEDICHACKSARLMAVVTPWPFVGWRFCGGECGAVAPCGSKSERCSREMTVRFACRLRKIITLRQKVRFIEMKGGLESRLCGTKTIMCRTRGTTSSTLLEPVPPHAGGVEGSEQARIIMQQVRYAR